MSDEDEHGNPSYLLSDDEDVFIPLGSPEERERWASFRVYLTDVDHAKTPEQFYQALAKAIRMSHLADEEGIEELAKLSMRPLEKRPANRPYDWRLRNQLFMKYCGRSGHSDFPTVSAAIRHMREHLANEGHPLTEDGAKSLYHSIKKSGVWWPRNGV